LSKYVSDRNVTIFLKKHISAVYMTTKMVKFSLLKNKNAFGFRGALPPNPLTMGSASISPL